MTIPYCPETPSGPQQRFLAFKEWEALYGGGMGSGKTSVILYGAFEHIENPQFNALILTHRYQDILGPGGIGQRALSWLETHRPGKFAFDSMNSRIMFDHGGIIWFGYFGVPDFGERYMSSNFQYIGVDDAHKDGYTEEGHRFLLSKLRGHGPQDQTQLKLRIAATPHEGWIKKRFIRDEYEGRPYLTPSAWSNPGIDADEYARVMKDNAFDSLSRELNGDWS